MRRPARRDRQRRPPRSLVRAAVRLALLGAATATAASAARRLLRVVVVEGSSMSPTYADGDRLLALYARGGSGERFGQAGRAGRARRGDVVVASAPDPTWTPDRAVDDAEVTVVKRVTAVAGDPRPDGAGRVPFGAVYVEGDAPGGYDSRVFGPLPRSQVLGRVLVRLSRGSLQHHGGRA